MAEQRIAAEQSGITVDGHRLTLLADGPERLRALLALIDGARSSLRLLYYIYQDDDVGQSVNAALRRALTRGVSVKLLVDGFGSANTPDSFFQELNAAGATVCRYLPTLGRRYLLRNHQKLALADAEEPASARIMIGGFNIAEDYFGTIESGAWRDLGLLVEGPAGSRLSPYFDELLSWARGRGERMRSLRKLIYRYHETQGALQWHMGGPTPRLSPCGA